MKAFLFKGFALFLPLILTVVMVNYLGDAARLFSSDYEKKIVDILLSHRSATNISNYNEKLLQRNWITQLHSTPDIVVIGSSKTMLIDSTMCGNHWLINNSVSGATLSDIVNIWHIYVAQKRIPHRVIIGLDAWMFNETAEQQHQEAPAYKQMIKDRSARTLSDTITTLFSLTYFQRSLPGLVHKIRGADQPIPTTQRYNFYNTKNPDGSLTYGEEYRNSNETEVKERVEIYKRRGDISDLNLLNSVSVDKWKQLEQLTNEMKAHGIKVTICLTPFYPAIYQSIQNRFPSGLNSEISIIQMVNQNHQELIGSFDPAKCGLSADCFYDAVHCNEKGIRLLLEQCKNY